MNVFAKLQNKYIEECQITLWYKSTAWLKVKQNNDKRQMLCSKHAKNRLKGVSYSLTRVFFESWFSKNLLILTNNSHLLGSMVFMCPNNTVLRLIHLSRKLQTMEGKNKIPSSHIILGTIFASSIYIVAAVDRVLRSYFTNSLHVLYEWFPVYLIFLKM